jgi:hypothetical protein
MRRNHLCKVVRAFLGQWNFNSIWITLLVHPLDGYRLSAFRMALRWALTWRHWTRLGINERVTQNNLFLFKLIIYLQPSGSWTINEEGIFVERKR